MTSSTKTQNMQDQTSDQASDLRYANDPNPADASQMAPRLGIAAHVNLRIPLERRGREVLRLAAEAFAQTGNWVVFYREMLGVDGVVRQLYPEPDLLRVFEQSPECLELQEMVAAMRGQDNSKSDSAEPERMITIRLPMSLHETLKKESDETNLSINQLCISKFIQPIPSRLVPLQQGGRRGRRPGPQGPRKQVVEPKDVTK